MRTTVIIAALLVASWASPASGQTVAGRMTTLAGDGLVGFGDGPAASAPFVYPAGVARGADGALYVADAGAQRIRVVRNGMVTTLAGSGDLDTGGMWVAAGYRDGPALQAQFNRPVGIAVDAHGNVFVADTANHCIREIADGRVTTFAGSFAPGARDGVGELATFQTPMQLAFDHDGNLLVADFGNGLRKVDPHGAVTTVLADKTALGVAVSTGPKRTLYVTDGSGLRFTVNNATYRIPNAENRTSSTEGRLSMQAELGHPYMAAAIDDSRLVYTDGWSGAVRLMNVYEGTVEVLAGSGDPKGNNMDAGFRDGPLGTARVSDPIEVAFAGGRVLIADSVNRRIRAIDGLNLRAPITPSVDMWPTEPAPPNTYRIAVIGNSYVFDDTFFDDSIEGVMEHALTSTRVGGRPIWIQPIRMQDTSLHALFDYLDQVVEPLHSYDLIVLLANNQLFRVEGPDWETVLNARLAKTQRALGADGVEMVAAYHPLPPDEEWDQTTQFPGRELFAPEHYPQHSRQPVAPLSAGSFAVLLGGAVPPVRPARIDEIGTVMQYDYTIQHDRIVTDIHASGTPLIDLFPDFVHYDKTSDHRPLFGTVDLHFSPAGRTLVGTLLAERIAPYLRRTSAVTVPSER